MLRNFIENLDMSGVPIGPQASLLEDLSHLNGMINHLDSSLQLKVTKKFKWQPGTYKKVEEIKKLLTGCNGRYKNVLDAWERQETNSRNYYVRRFRRDLMQLDNTIKDKRYEGAVWIEDDSVIQDIKDEAINKIIKAFDDYEKYIKTFNKTSLTYIVFSNKTEEDIAFYRYLDEELNDSFQFSGDSKIILREKTGHVYIIHPFKDVIMNVYSGDETYPIYKYKIGNVLNCFKLSAEWLLRWSLGTSYNRNNVLSNHSIYWFKPYNEGLRHPFINFGYSDSNRMVNVKDWKIGWERPGNTCFGNINYLYGNTDLNLIQYYETANLWLSTFRVGLTNPLNPIDRGYYGHPSVHNEDTSDENDSNLSRYMDRIGMNVGQCYDTMSDNIIDVNRRNEICLTQCIDNIRSSCDGFKWDSTLIKRERIAKWSSTDKPFNDDNLEVLRVNNVDISFAIEEADDNYYMEVEPNLSEIIDSEQQNLQNDMLGWINGVQGNE